jgi:release factor glutamine methyltransferase
VSRIADSVVLAPPLTIAQARRAVADCLRGRGFDTPDLDARLLVGHALGLDHSALAAASTRALTPTEAARLDAVLTRRLAHEPVARIRGSKEFWSLPLAVTPDVLVPRPETETVVEAALAVVARDRALRIADLGTGSGAILLALLSELPAAQGIGTDRSERALAVARRNANALGLADRAAFIVCHFADAITGSCDLVVANPPYIPSDEIATLAPDVRDYDPSLALDGGGDGLAAYRAIAADAARVLAPGGWLTVEIGIGQAEAVAALLAQHGLAIPGKPRHDLAGLPRAVVGQRLGHGSGQRGR